MDAALLRKELNSGKARAVYWLTGPETFLVEESLRLLVESLLPPEERELGASRLYADESSVEAVLNEAKTLPFLSRRRVVIVRRAESWEGLFVARRKASSSQEQEEGEADEEVSGRAQGEEALKGLLDYLANPSPETHLVFVTRRADGRLPLVKKLKDMGALVECSTMSEGAAANWVRERSKGLGLEFTGREAALLVEHVGQDLQRLDRELDKLSVFVGRDELGAVEAIETLAYGGRERSVFELTDAIANQDAETALRRLETLLSVGDGGGPMHPLRILASLAGEVRKVWLVKDSLQKGMADQDIYNRSFKTPVKRLSNWHRDKIKELAKTAKRFSDADLARIMNRLLQADAELKGEGTSERRTLEALVLDLCGAGEAERAGP
jgi:DNA polymerase-3 subunit delta